ncbi:fatty acid desaturase [Plectosphaerella plurivora]|uniref:Delta 8-(E)-sphingolipid desaturase n=1 Tax=Plectosphaerella plurivora TaxID=936078 RepID=A0A9P8V7G8_9PEZI|nr:fatty acid desaturase [Plectosphaerella plurivora]
MSTRLSSGKGLSSKPLPVLSRRQIEGLIADGRHIIIVDGFVLKVDHWLPYHPGGDKAIQHMVGRDATDEVTVLHAAETKAQMMKYKIGRIEGIWQNFLPPIQGGTFRAVTDEEQVLGDQAAATVSHETGGLDIPSASASSREPSPVFDEGSTLRARLTTGGAFDSPASSASEDEGELKKDLQKTLTPTGFLDSETRKEISLDLDKYPSLDSATQDRVAQKYRALNERIEAEGLYRCNYTSYLIEISRYTLLFAGMLFFLQRGWYVPSAICLGIFWHQLVFAAHDAGHMGITHNFHIDSCIGIFIADFLGGLSMGWWKRSHNVHHIVTNHPEHDPDIEHMPFFAVSHRLLGSLYSTYYERIMEYDAAAKVLISIQPYTYYFIMLFGRFNLYRLSWDHLILGRGPKRGPAAYQRWLEVAGQVFFWTWFGYGIIYKCIPTAWDRFVFVIVSHMLQSPLHVQITLSHFAMSTADLGPAESFPQKMLRTTMDVDCPTWLDFFHGGLQFQAIHHLYPRIPRHNLRRTQKLVQEFCDDVGIPYALYGFVDGNKTVVGRLSQVSRQAAILAECQKSLATHH